MYYQRDPRENVGPDRVCQVLAWNAPIRWSKCSAWHWIR
jgi:hypothetical protein